MPQTRRRRRPPWKPLFLLAVAFLLLGAAGDGNTTIIIAFLGAGLSIGGAGVGYGLTKAEAKAALKRADAAHTAIAEVETDVGQKIDRLTGSFNELRLDLAESGVIKRRRES